MRDSLSNTKFYLAIKSNDTKTVKRLIHEGRVEIDQQFFPQKMTAIQIAIDEGLWEVFELLIHYRCSVNKADSCGITPLLTACRTGKLNRLNFVERLLSERANVNCADYQNLLTPLHWAVMCRDELMVQLLLDSGADHSRPNRSFRTPLHLAIQSQWSRGAELLIKAGSDANYRDKDGFSPFYYACICFSDVQTRHRLLLLMLASGADLSLEYWATAKNEDLITGVDMETLEWLDGQRCHMPFSLKWLCRTRLRQELGQAADEGCIKLTQRCLPKTLKSFLLFDAL